MIQKRLKQTKNAINLFLKRTKKNYLTMKTSIKITWACILFAIIALNSCNVTRKVTTEASYCQKGDTTTTIVTKTTETYDAKKNQ